MAYIIQRSFSLAVGGLTSTNFNEGLGQWTEVTTIGFPYFTAWVKDNFDYLLLINLQKCKEKCKNEFFSAETIYWGYSKYFSQPTARW